MKSREPFCTKNALHKRMRISRNVLFVIVDDDDNDNTSMKRKGASVRWKKLRARVKGKFEIRKKKI